MLERYPHTVKIIKHKLVTTNSEGESLNGLMGNDKSEEIEQTIKGRVEMKPSHVSKGYIAKFYTDKQNVSLFKNDGLNLDFEGRMFKIVNWDQKQTNLILWLAD
jgi:hypothetical protein